jgi:hypothetical protein
MDLKVVCAIENSNNSKKLGFGTKNQLRIW